MFTSSKVKALLSQRGFKIMLVSIFLSSKDGRPKNIPQHLCSNHWQTQEFVTPIYRLYRYVPRVREWFF